MVLIMRVRSTLRLLLSLALVLALLSGFTSALASEASYGTEPDPVITVSTVDELLAAIGPDRTILLAPGVYDLSAAADYGTYDYYEANPHYWWEEVYDGFELVIADVENLTIAAADPDPANTVISAAPRYADVLSFRYCRMVTLSGITAGHTVLPSECSGGVISLLDVDVMNITDCDLYGCGVLGLQADNSRNIFVVGTTIRECSDGAVNLCRCFDVRFVECTMRDCGKSGYYPAFSMIYADESCGVAVLDSEIIGNNAVTIFNAYGSSELYMFDTLVQDNTCPSDWGELILFNDSYAPFIVAGCQFQPDAYAWTGDACVVDREGRFLSEEELFSMTREFVNYEGPAVDYGLEWSYVDGMASVTVYTVDQLLAALRPDTVVYLAPGEYDLTEAINYGTYGGSYYYWAETYDGYELVVSGAEGLHLVGEAPDTTLICTEPRYAGVLTFEHGANVSLAELSVGHTQEPDYCAGSVLYFRYMDGVIVSDCGLFGCGTLGVDASNCENITVIDCEIYQCSLGAVSLFGCRGGYFFGNDIHDCAWPTYDLFLCKDIEIDGEPVEETPIENEYGADWGGVVDGIFASGRGIDYITIDLPDAGPYQTYGDEYPDAVG